MYNTKAIKLHSGHYEYRGYEIEKVEGLWLVRELDDVTACDAADTLTECKAIVDNYKD